MQILIGMVKKQFYIDALLHLADKKIDTSCNLEITELMHLIYLLLIIRIINKKK